MKPKKLFKSTIKIEVLSDEKIPEDTPLAKILHETDEGMWVARRMWDGRNNKVIGNEAVKECEKFGTEPDFFEMDYNGNELLDE